MIHSITVANYKCLKGITLHASGLTLLTGTNSVGKSSFLQALLLTRCAGLASEAQASTTAIPLNGPYGLSLGEFADILSHQTEETGKAEIEITVLSAAGKSKLTLTGDADSARYTNASFVPKPPSCLTSGGLGSFCYLSAEREGPRDFSVLQSVPKEKMEIGYRGQNLANILQACERDPVREQLEHPLAVGPRLQKTAEAWLSNFVPGVEMRAEVARGLDVVALRFKRGGVQTEWERPSNTGFGVSYCLPIIIAGLVAKERSILIVDSPEAHLHPSAQSAMGSFLARLSASGVQVFVETHSDHVINGIRLAAVDASHPLDRSDVIINHLRQKEDSLIKEEITIDAHGALSARPPEFFDQAENDLARIVKSRFPSQ